MTAPRSSGAGSVSVGIVGARGHVGAELVRLLSSHPVFRIAYVSSRGYAGRRVEDVIPGAPPRLVYEELGPEDAAARAADVCVLALPNGLSGPFVSALRRETVVDLSADHRFESGWAYGLPERDRSWDPALPVAVPGCYATAVQLAAGPLLDLVSGPVHAFGVSGYSGAGTAPSPRNDPELLRDQVTPYSLTGHVHERECSFRLGHDTRFSPHVAPFFRGLSVTLQFSLARPATAGQLTRRLEDAYRDEPFVTAGPATPSIREVTGTVAAAVGGASVSEGGGHAAVACALDNLLKGAASQALQCMNRKAGLPEVTGLVPDGAGLVPEGAGGESDGA